MSREDVAEYLDGINSNILVGGNIKKYPFKKLDRYLIYYYRIKFKLPRRKAGIPKGKPRYGTPVDQIVFPNAKELQNIFSKAFPIREDSPLSSDMPDFVEMGNLAWRSYFWLHYYTVLRKSEVYTRLLDDFVVEKENLKILAVRLKKIKKYDEDENRIPQKPLPFYVPLSVPHIGEVLLYLRMRRERGGERAFPFISSFSAWSEMKKVLKIYPHAWRFRFLDRQAHNNEFTIADMMGDSGLDLATINVYLSKYRSGGIGSAKKREAMWRE